SEPRFVDGTALHLPAMLPSRGTTLGAVEMSLGWDLVALELPGLGEGCEGPPGSSRDHVAACREGRHRRLPPRPSRACAEPRGAHSRPRSAVARCATPPEGRRPRVGWRRSRAWRGAGPG